jgi:hypothetical protein
MYEVLTKRFPQRGSYQEGIVRFSQRENVCVSSKEKMVKVSTRRRRLRFLQRRAV